MTLEFVPFHEVTLIRGGAHELVDRRDYPFRRRHARAFAITVTGAQPGERRWQLFSRSRFLRLLGTLRRSSMADEPRAVELFGLRAAGVPIIKTVDASPESPSVVVERNHVAGVWIEVAPGRREIPSTRFTSWSGKAVGIASAMLRTTPMSDVGFYIGRHAELMEPVATEMVAPPELGDLLADISPEVEAPPVRVADETIRRTPHLDVADTHPLKPGGVFDAVVFVDQAPPRPFERSQDVVVAAPTSKGQFRLTVCVLVSDHFTLVDDGLKVLTIQRSKAESRPIRFRVEVKNDPSAARGAPSVSALFFYGHRPAGKVTRLIAVEGCPAPPSDGPPPSTPLEAHSLGIPPDLLVQVSRASDGQDYECFVSSPLLDDFRQPVRAKWGYRDGAESMVKLRMKHFADPKLDAQPRKRLAALVGAGRDLYKDTPINFQTAFAQLLAKSKGPYSILVATEEPVLPWEILVPPDLDRPLGVTQRLGRWSDPNPPRQDARIIDTFVYAPSYSEGRRLEKGDEEAKYVCDNLRGIRKTASFASFESDLSAHVPRLLHFICHGADTGQPFQSVYFDDDEDFDSDMLLGLTDLSVPWKESEPVVFMNACEVGRAIPGLVGAGGFAQSFITLGSRGVVAPLWTVKSEFAYEVAKGVYGAALAEPERPIADIVRALRAKSYDEPSHEDSFAAYCWYGDPDLCVRVG